jgi:hypothetical protein
VPKYRHFSLQGLHNAQKRSHWLRFWISWV